MRQRRLEATASDSNSSKVHHRDSYLTALHTNTARKLGPFTHTNRVTIPGVVL